MCRSWKHILNFECEGLFLFQTLNLEPESTLYRPETEATCCWVTDTNHPPSSFGISWTELRFLLTAGQKRSHSLPVCVHVRRRRTAAQPCVGVPQQQPGSYVCAPGAQTQKHSGCGRGGAALWCGGGKRRYRFNFYSSSVGFKCTGNSVQAWENSQNPGGAVFPFCWDRFVSSDATALDLGPGTPLSSSLEPF